ncbi:MAG: hypothetical protein FD169_1135 [Bacillota bacterium]|nr:MAG: hypothetical protein FD169_1135 [Bacillota bacterium]
MAKLKPTSCMTLLHGGRVDGDPALRKILLGQGIDVRRSFLVNLIFVYLLFPL